jgi:Flp pilus assembly protein TadD
MSADAAMRQAAALFGAGRLDEAWKACEAILAGNPQHFYALHLASAIALKRAQFDACITLATHALTVSPGHAEVLANRGAALRRTNRAEEALADYDQALAAGASTPTLLVNRGIALAALNRHGEAIAQYDHAIALDARHATAYFHRGLSRLVTGDLPSGFADNEWRWAGSETQGPPRALPGRRFTGAENVAGMTVLLYAEQGLGDTIQFARYAKLLKERGARVVLEVHPPLKRLLTQVAGADNVIAMGDPLPLLDYHCPLLSAPLAFGTTLETIPRERRYVDAEESLARKWEARIASRSGARVGFAWSGSRTLVNDSSRSIPLAALAPLIAAAPVAVSLQMDVRERDRPALDAGALVQVEGIEDFADTAAIVDALDLVVTVDTSVAHLAGALGKPVWILLPFSPDWRWLLDRDDSPWYPSARLFRQPAPGDWKGVIGRVAAELAELK